MSRTREMKPLTTEQQELVLSCVKLAASLAKRWGRRYPWMADDYHCEAMLALVESAVSYDPERSKFTTYAYNGINFRLRGKRRFEAPMGYRRLRVRRHIPMTRCLHGIPYDEHPSVRDPEFLDPVGFESRIAPLCERHRDIMRMLFVEEMKLQDICDRLHVSKWTVARDYSRAIAVLRVRHAGADGDDVRCPRNPT